MRDEPRELVTAPRQVRCACTPPPFDRHHVQNLVWGYKAESRGYREPTTRRPMVVI